MNILKPSSPRTFLGHFSQEMLGVIPEPVRKDQNQKGGSILANMVLVVAPVNTVSDSKCPGMVMIDVA